MKFRTNQLWMWGVLGVVLALAVALGGGQEPPKVAPIPIVAPPLFSIPPGEWLGDVFAVVDPRAEVEEQLFTHVKLDFRAKGPAPFTGHLIAFNLEPFDAQPPTTKEITPAIILARAPFSDKRPTIPLDVRVVKPTALGVLVLVEKSGGIDYTLTVTPIHPPGPTFTPAVVLDNVKVTVIRVGHYRFSVPGGDEPVVLLRVPTEIKEVCRDKVTCWNPSYRRFKICEFRVCARKTDPGYVRYLYTVSKHPTSDPLCWLIGVGWDKAHDPTDLTVVIRIRCAPRQRCVYEYVVLQCKP